MKLCFSCVFGHVHRLGHLGHSVLFGFKFGPSVFGKNPGYAVAAPDRHAINHVTQSKTGYWPKFFFLLAHRVMIRDRQYIGCFVISPPRIFNFGNAASRSFLVVDLVRAFKCFSASDVKRILCEPFVVKASQPMR